MNLEAKKGRASVALLAALSAALLAVLSAAGCASSDPKREARITQAISGAWESEATDPDRSGWRRALTAFDGRSAPQPTLLVIRGDGSFDAHYEAETHRMMQRILGGEELGNPISGRWSIRLDWNGTPWISFDPGAPERRLTMSRGELTLHSVDTLWPNESYRRSSGSSAQLGTIGPK